MLNVLMAALIAFSVGCSVPSIATSSKDDDLSFSTSAPTAITFSNSENKDAVDTVETNAESPARLPVIPPLYTSIIYDSFMQAYFRGLGATKNIGENQKGSCSYVAIGMMLSYYDTFLSDRIIPAKYDVEAVGNNSIVMDKNSPGILNDPASNTPDDLSAYEYYNIMESMADVSLHAKLITIGKNLGYYNFGDSISPCALAMHDAISVLKAYFAEIGISESLYSFEIIDVEYGYSANEVKDFVKDNIDKGFPVFADIASGGVAHAVVCYGYDSYWLYAHLGWTRSEDEAYFKIENSFYGYRRAMVLKFNMAHSHSRNYRVKFGNINKTYCYCESGMY